MNSTSPSHDRLLPVSLLTCAAVFVAVAGWIVVGAFIYQQFYRTASQFRWRGDSNFIFWRGEVVFSEERIDPSIGPVGPSEVRAFDPRTGTVRSTGISVPTYIQGFVTIGNRLLVVSQNEVVETDGTTTTHHKPHFTLPTRCTPFVLNGQAATIAQDKNGQDRLYTFIDGQWQPGPRVALPGSGRTWAHDAQRDRNRLVPRTTKGGATVAGASTITKVWQIGDDLHVVSTSSGAGQYGSAYRLGLDYVTVGDAPSALAPENAPADATGWHELDSRTFNPWTTPCSIGGEFHLVTAAPQCLWKPDPANPGRFVPAQATPIEYPYSIAVATSETGEQACLIERSRLQTLTFQQLNGNRFERLPHKVPGWASLFLSLERTLIGLFLTVLAASHLIMLIGAIWLTNRRGQHQYSFGRHEVTLAPLGRRWLARGIDLACPLVPLIVVGIWRISTIDADDLFQLQFDAVNGLGGYTPPGSFGQPDWSALRSDTAGIAAFAWAAGYAVLSILLQGRAGFTPGKLLCRLRVVRTTLRPCGLLRALLRDLLLCLDTLFLLTPIPGVATILMNDNRWRLGDMAADTLVIDARSCPASIFRNRGPTSAGAPDGQT